VTAEAFATTGPVKIIGAGLLGASIGLALTTRGIDVRLSDASPTVLALACSVGAGRVAEITDDEPHLVVVAAPPDVAGPLVIEALKQHPNAIVTDVASVKDIIAQEIAQAGADARRYVGSHPMAGREKSGPTAAMADLFAGRPWVLCPMEQTDSAALVRVRELAVDLGATPLVLSSVEHDAAVALISHVPQVVASVMAAQLTGASEASMGLAGQGLRDLTRIAAGDAGLWTQILAGNAAAVARVLRGFTADLEAVTKAVEQLAHTWDDPKALQQVARAIAEGNTGYAAIPGKHGTRQREYDTVVVLVPDKPGELGRLFAEVGQLEINIEDLELEHSPRQPVGLARISVLRGVGEELSAALQTQGWTIAG